VLIAPSTFVSPSGFDAMLVCEFTAAVIDQLDSPPGAVIGGLVLGLALSYVSGYLGSDIVTLATFVVLVLVLMIRPHGLLGTGVRRRV
ncbi:branched-chain amino acid ABC transporter permease, partial [Kibdelosporangium lantanae]